jgi:FKBP-type peptidyl-prolyl cis-trans isomerase FkpA
MKKISLLMFAFIASSAYAATGTAETLPSGVTITQIKAGTGPQPTAADTVTVNYRGTLANGTEFDSSYKRGTPASFPLGRVIPCWTQGLQKMKVGGKARLVCPPATAYGDRGVGTIPPGSTLTFEVELLKIGG